MFYSISISGNVPYHPINLRRKLRTCFKNSLPQCNIKIILKPTNRLSSLFHFKYVIPKELQSHVIYKNFRAVTAMLLTTRQN